MLSGQQAVVDEDSGNVDDAGGDAETLMQATVKSLVA